MTLQHMIEHLILAVRSSNGKLKIECFNPKEKIPALKRFLLSERPLPKNFINPVIGEDLLPLEYKNLKSAFSALKSEIDDYYIFFETNPETLTTNPTFGNLNKEEWDLFHKKHFTHHLEQFGLKPG
ncbi:MAG: DUF1569 domain-containing protein [Melioribacteraceae bacterium]|nr:DUF1569 domain-containing protein [Melioribacteraceae bacterium]